MSDVDFTGGARGNSGVERGAEDRPVGGPRLHPAVNFGVRAAVLAGLILPASGVAAGLGGALADVSNVAYTTCCGGKKAISAPL